MNMLVELVSVDPFGANVGDRSGMRRNPRGRTVSVDPFGANVGDGGFVLH